jgi:hypothetical protein
MHQVTIHVTITDSTPRAIAAIIDDADDHLGSTAPEPGRQTPFLDLAQAPMLRSRFPDHETSRRQVPKNAALSRRESGLTLTLGQGCSMAS